jgi:hypothetical protein
MNAEFESCDTVAGTQRHSTASRFNTAGRNVGMGESSGAINAEKSGRARPDGVLSV